MFILYQAYSQAMNTVGAATSSVGVKVILRNARRNKDDNLFSVENNARRNKDDNLFSFENSAFI